MIGMNYTTVLSIGSRVYSILYGGRAGTVYRIEGAQNKGRKTELVGGCMVTGPACYFDVVFDCGSVSRQLPESIVKGVQWRLLEGFASAEAIAMALEFAEATKARKEAEKRDEKAAFAAEVARLKTAPEFAHLAQGDDLYSGKLAAANIRAELKRVFKGVKFSVRKTSYGSVSVEWTDGPTAKQVEALYQKHEASHFDGMQDLHTPIKSPFTVVFGGSDYLFYCRHESPALIARAIDALMARYPGNFDGMEKPTVEQYQQGDLIRVQVPGFGDSVAALVRRELIGLEG